MGDNGMRKRLPKITEEEMKELEQMPLNPTEESIPVDCEVMVKLADIVNKYGLECPNSNNCGNKGTLAEHGCDGTEEDCARTCPVPVQCEFCYCEPKSKFNLENDLQELIKSKFSE